MKRLVFVFFTIFTFVNIAFADTETINWYVDGQTYLNTTCESGSTVVLPNAPTKTGYSFVGWREAANRGTYANWASVPENSNQYSTDEYNITTPMYGDYIFVTNMEDYPYKNFTLKCVSSEFQIIINGQTISYEKIFPVKNIGPAGCLTVETSNGKLIFNKTVKQGNTIRNAGTYIWIGCTNTYNFELVCDGTWKFVYEGEWLRDGKQGWKIKEQITQ